MVSVIKAKSKSRNLPRHNDLAIYSKKSDYIKTNRKLRESEFILRVKSEEIQKLKQVVGGKEECLQRKEGELKDRQDNFDQLIERSSTNLEAAISSYVSAVEVTLKLKEEVEKLIDRKRQLECRIEDRERKLEAFRDFSHDLSRNEWSEEGGNKYNNFKDGQEVMEILEKDKETCLFLTQKNLETRQTLDEMGKCFHNIQRKFDDEIKAVGTKINLLKDRDVKETDKVKFFKDAETSEEELSKIEAVVDERLHEKIVQVYHSCGKSKNGSNSVKMLTEIEDYLEELIRNLNSFPSSYLKKIYRAKQREKKNAEMEKGLEERRKQRELRKARQS